MTVLGRSERGGRSETRTQRRPSVSTRHRGETGFTLIEVVIAFTILGVLFLAIEWAAIGGSTASVTAAQRATATSLAAQAIAQAQALPFADLKLGLNSSQLSAVLACSSWPEVTSSGVIYYLQLPGTPRVTILTANTATAGEAPLVPLSCPPSQQVGGVTYNIAVFPSPVTGNAALVTLTAIVTWSAPPVHNQTTTVEQVEVGVQ
jgi:prepilin-type N-terminal cleavage/methylation domain-containing protein